MASQFDDFVRAYESDEYLPLRRHIEAHSFQKALGDVGGKSVLDIGCGAGLYTRLLKQWGAGRVTGLDSAQNMIEYAQAREAEEQLGVEYVQDDASNAATYGPCDVVTAIYVLPYAPNAEAYEGLCRAVFDALVPGGRLVAMPIAPTIRYASAYYKKYGFTLDPEEERDGTSEPLPDFSPVRLRSVVEQIPLDVVAYHTSSDMQEQLLWKVGFSTLTWHRPEVTQEGVDRFGADLWKDYLDRPHSAPLVCTKPL